ncbi:hypothetical protein GCM10009743_17210 [Kribbella swartbergensis]
MAALWANEGWAVSIPERRLTPGHLTITSRRPNQPLDQAAAEGLLEAYRRTRAGLWDVGNYRGFAVSFAVGWRPDEDGVGEPDPVDGFAIHVFGRRRGDSVSPVRVMAVPRPQRTYAVPADRTEVAGFRSALASAAEIAVPGPKEEACDGCTAEAQELWLAGDVRVIRPRRTIIESQVIVLPVRHVVSAGDLTPVELVSIGSRLREVLDAFKGKCTGLSCFLNDGSEARQETPHVHIHVFGRSRREPANPFKLLAVGNEGARLPC